MNAPNGARVARMTINFVDKAWSLKQFLLNHLATKGIGMSADDHESVIRAAFLSVGRIGIDVLVFSATSNIEASIALSID